MSDTTLASRLCEKLRENAGCIFTVPGTQNIGLLNQLTNSQLQVVNASSELGAAFMANGWARKHPKPAVLMTIAGPGITTAISGITEALHDSAPILVIVVEGIDRKRTFDLQKIDLDALLSPVCKEVLCIDSLRDAAALIDRALHTVSSDEPGPVVLRLAAPLLFEKCPESTYQTEVSGGHPELAELARRIKESRKPIVFAGAGASGAAPVLLDIIENGAIPVVTTASGRGTLSDSHPFCLTYDFSFGVGPMLNALLDGSDLILVLGAKLSHNGTGGFSLKLPQERLVRIDTSSIVLEANYPASLSICCDASVALTTLSGLIDDYRSAWTDSELVEKKASLADEAASLAPRPPKLAGLPASEFFSALRAACGRGTTFCTDSGYHQVLTRQYLEVLSPRTLVLPSDFQSMGFGLPAAIGASLADPSSRTTAIIGDGGFLMTATELASAVHLDLNLSVIVLRDEWYGLIRMQQAATFGRTPSTALPNFSVQKYAEAAGAQYFLLDKPTEANWRQLFPRSGVVVAEVPVGKLPGLSAKQAGTAVKEQIRSVLGQDAINSLKKLLGR
ncbi:MAG: thiamine pyrophosphate-binding protein [Bdellovibrionales bacterium]|nr:thiamine pyrophosphate-binding protein [Bdellovibrionales bacterium]